MVVFLAPVLTVAYVVAANGASGVYGIEDSVVIPVAEALVVALFTFALCSPVAALSFSVADAPYSGKQVPRRIAASLLALLPLLVLVTQLVGWANPQHYPIAVAYGLPVGWVAWTLLRVFRANAR